MTKRINIAIAAAALIAGTSCTKLDVPVESQLAAGSFPKTVDQYISVTGPVYQRFATSGYATDMFRANEFTTEEAMIPTRDQGYYDNAVYIKWHKHTWTEDDVLSQWTWGFSGISDCNRIIPILEGAADTTINKLFVAEIKTMRALYYFYMMDMYGNIPITTTSTTELPKQYKRAEVCAHIEKELLAAIPNLATPSTVDIKYYGRPTRWMAYALLQKLYLNWETYTGTKRYNDAITYGNKIMAESGLTLVGDYMSLFSPKNGANTETIFAAIFDADKGKGNHLMRFGLHGNLQRKYNLVFAPSNAMCTTLEFFNLFNLAGDARDTTWLSGPQYLFDKTTPIINSNGGGVQLVIEPNIQLVNAERMDVGPEKNGISYGARSVKYYPDPNTIDRFANNDMPVLRLGDVYLMQAEAILRNGGDASTAVEMVNRIRRRVNAPVVSSITLDELLNERGRELAWEGWRRNDLIRFGKYEGKWGFKAGNESPNLRLFPIPSQERAIYPHLIQNDGYK